MLKKDSEVLQGSKKRKSSKPIMKEISSKDANSAKITKAKLPIEQLEERKCPSEDESSSGISGNNSPKSLDSRSIEDLHKDLLEKLNALNESCKDPATPSLDPSAKQATSSNGQRNKAGPSKLITKDSNQDKDEASTSNKRSCNALSEDEHDDDDESDLVISLPKKRKKERLSFDSMEVPEYLLKTLADSVIDDSIDEKAQKVHMTAAHVKKIIKDVLTDESVLAMYRNILGVGEPIIPSSSTVTRSRAKEMMKENMENKATSPLPPPGWVSSDMVGSVAPASQAAPEIQALATTDFPEEEDDEDYSPEADEHLLSDEESGISTFGSPFSVTTPRVIATPPSNISTPTSAINFADRTNPTSNAQRNLDFANVGTSLICSRTRSKFSYTDTPLEDLEKAFKPPDITPDMYEIECDDEVWKEFLLDFNEPLNPVEALEEDDEQVDPEYNILVDAQQQAENQMDDLAWELRADKGVKITRKEYRELMSEFVDSFTGDDQHETKQEVEKKNLRRNELLSKLQQPHEESDEECSPNFTPNNPQELQPLNTSELTIENQDTAPITVKILPIFPKEYLKSLKNQLMQHVQLLASITVLSSSNHRFKLVSNGCQAMLADIKKTFPNEDFSYYPWNLNAAFDMISYHNQQPSSHKDSDSWSSDEEDEDTKKDITLEDFPEEVLKTFLQSSALPFAKLLPTCPLKVKYKNENKRMFFQSHNVLIAMKLEELFSNNEKVKNEFEKSTKGIYGKIAKEIRKDYLLVFSKKCLENHIRFHRQRFYHKSPISALFKNLKNGEVACPSFSLKLEEALPNTPCPLKDVPKDLLPKPWNDIVKCFWLTQPLSEKYADEKFKMNNIIIIQDPMNGTQIIIPPKQCTTRKIINLSDNAAIPQKSLQQLTHENYPPPSCNRPCIPSDKMYSNYSISESTSRASTLQTNPGFRQNSPQHSEIKGTSNLTKDDTVCQDPNRNDTIREMKSAPNLSLPTNSSSQTPVCFDGTKSPQPPLGMPFLPKTHASQKGLSEQPAAAIPEDPVSLKEEFSSQEMPMSPEPNNPKHSFIKEASIKSTEPEKLAPSNAPSLLETPSKAISEDIAFKTPSTKPAYLSNIPAPFLETPGKFCFPTLETPVLNASVASSLDSQSLETPVISKRPSRPVTPELDEAPSYRTSPTDEKADQLPDPPHKSPLTKSATEHSPNRSETSALLQNEDSSATEVKSCNIIPLETPVKCDFFSSETPIAKVGPSSQFESHSLETPVVGNLPSRSTTPEFDESTHHEAVDKAVNRSPSPPSLMKANDKDSTNPSEEISPSIKMECQSIEFSSSSSKLQIKPDPKPLSNDSSPSPISSNSTSISTSPLKMLDLVDLEASETPMEAEDIEIIAERITPRSSTHEVDGRVDLAHQHDPHSPLTSGLSDEIKGLQEEDTNSEACKKQEKNPASVKLNEKCEIVLSNISIPAEGGSLSQIVAESSICEAPEDRSNPPILCTVDSSLSTPTKNAIGRNQTEQQTFSTASMLLAPIARSFVTPPKILPRVSPIKFRAIRKSPYKSSPVKTSPILKKKRKLSPQKFLRRKPAFILPRKRVLRARLPNIQYTPATVTPASNSENSTASINHSVKGSDDVTPPKESDATTSQTEPPECELGEEIPPLVVDEDKGERDEKEAPAGSAEPPAGNSGQVEEEEEELDLIDEEDDIEDDDEVDQQQKEEHLAALLKASSTIHSRRGERRVAAGANKNSQKMNKQQRHLQARIDALARVSDSEVKTKALSLNYIIRVREALLPHDKAKFQQFISLLRNFEEKPYAPEKLYFEITDLLKDFPLLCDEFVAFLMPQQAQKVGKFTEYCAVQRIMDFVEKLQHHFGRDSPDVFKIIRMIQSFQKKATMDFDEMKTFITPILRYPHLVESFIQCFPTQAPSQSLPDDFEEVNFDDPGTPDSAENINLLEEDLRFSPDHCTCACHANSNSANQKTPSALAQGKSDHCISCGLRFIDGRVYLQCGKTLRPARVTYLAKKEENPETTALPPSSAQLKHKSKKPQAKDSTATQAHSKPKHDKPSKPFQKPIQSEQQGQASARSESENARLGEQPKPDEGPQEEKTSSSTKERKTSKEPRSAKSSVAKGAPARNKSSSTHSARRVKGSATSSRKREKHKGKAKKSRVGNKLSTFSDHRNSENSCKSSDLPQAAKPSGSGKLKPVKPSQTAPSNVGDADAKSSRQETKNPFSSKGITLELQKLPKDDSWSKEDDLVIFEFLKEKETPESLNSLFSRFPKHTSEQVKQRLKSVAHFILTTLNC